MRPDESNGKVWRKNGRPTRQGMPRHYKLPVATVGYRRQAQLDYDAIVSQVQEDWDAHCETMFHSLANF